MDSISFEYYINQYYRKFDECVHEAVKEDFESYDDLDFDYLVEAHEHFEEVANADEVAGYYLANFKENAYSRWLENTRRVDLNAQDKIVEHILRDLCTD